MSVNDLNNTSQTDWERLEAMTDEEIDYSDIPPLTEEFFNNATLRIPKETRGLENKESLSSTWGRGQSIKKNNQLTYFTHR